MRNAAEMVEVSYSELPAVVGAENALKAGAAQIHENAPNNLIFDWGIGEEAATDAAIAGAAKTVSIELTNNRVSPNAMEPRAALAQYDESDDQLTLHTTSQNPHVARLVLSAFYQVAPENKLRVIAPDVGGGFGSKIYIYPEEIVCLWACRKAGVPAVKWTSDRTEAFLTQYNIPNIYGNVRTVYTNTTPVDAYRGAGRPEARKAEAAARGKMRGIGMSCYIEACGIAPSGSRSGAVGMSAILKALEKVEDKARKIAAHTLEAAEDDIVIKDGEVSVKGTDKKMLWHEVSLAAYVAHNLPEGMEPGLKETAFYDPANFTFPAGCYICEVEVDPDTGVTDIIKYVAADDFGTIINPQIVEGQVHGGITQGIGQALLEGVVYGDDGQMLTASYMDYTMPRADDVPSYEVSTTATPSPSNPLGITGDI